MSADPKKLDTPREVAAYEAFAKLWEALVAKGEKRGWLKWTNEYPGSHLELVTPREREGQRLRLIQDAKDREERWAREAKAKEKQVAYDKAIADAEAAARKKFLS